MGKTIVRQINDDWAVGADNLQWILLRRRSGPQPWYGVSFVSSTKEILARCMRENGVPAGDAEMALDVLPKTFKHWSDGAQELVIDDLAPSLAPGRPPDEIIAPTSSLPNDWSRRRRACLKRDRHRCQRCGASEHLTVHHLKPRAWGGSDAPGNLITLCAGCHDIIEIKTEDLGRPMLVEEVRADAPPADIAAETMKARFAALERTTHDHANG